MALDPEGKKVHQGRIADVLEVTNQDHKFGANKTYYAIRIQLADGTEKTALFTWNQLAEAIERAEKNQEDIPQSGLFGKIQDLLD